LGLAVPPALLARVVLAAHVRFWHKADMAIALSDVRYWG
jgi:hypothetical protein